ncbi:MAG: hypothetical protein AAGF11_18110 [Myxococcota bacterium]
MKPFELTGQERKDLLEFLETLTDEEFLTDPRFSDPWAEGERAPLEHRD